ncbi:MAG: CxxC-x17-CxxC domain-containing protein, partial [Patescibacteria group bacterium]
IRNIVGQTVSSFDVRKIMDERNILIMNLSKGRLGEDNSALLGAMMITKIQLAAMGRVDIPEETRADFYLYVDEFQNFATESFANILSEARKYHLNLILANQYVTQIDEKVRDAIFGNAGSIISFRVGAMDAEFLEKEFEPVFMMNDIVNLPKFQIYLKLMIDGIAGDAFSATTLPPIALEDVGNDEKVIAVSRERYSGAKDEVEDKIRRWSGMLTEEEKQAVYNQVASKSGESAPQATPTKSVPPKKSQPSGDTRKPVMNTKPPVATTKPVAPKPVSPKPVIEEAVVVPAPVVEKKAEAIVEKEVIVAPESIESATPEVAEAVSAEPVEAKVMYTATCATCGEEIQVPFKPDGSRPTFCKDCLRDYQRATAKVRLEIEQKNAAVGEKQKTSAPIQSNQPKKRVYAPEGTPMKLSQTRTMGPKKFKSLRQKPQVNLGELRSMIEATREGMNE